MGSLEGEEGRRENEGPVHRVTLSPFVIAKTELTQAQWLAVMGSSAEEDGSSPPFSTRETS